MMDDMNRRTDEEHDPFSLEMRLLAERPITLYCKRQVLEEAQQWFLHHQYEVAVFDCRSWEKPADFYTEVQRTLGFPPVPRWKLEAFNAALSGIGDPHQLGTVLIFLRFETFATRLPQFAWRVLDIIAVRSYHWLLASYQLIALVQSDDPQLSVQPVGARPVLWNHLEWRTRSRGVQS